MEMMIFIQIITFKKSFLVQKSIMRVFFRFMGMLFNTIIFFSMKRGYKSIFRFVSILFNVIMNVIIF